MSKPRVSLTHFIDFTAAQGTSRVTQVRRAIQYRQTDYSAGAFDYWKRLREAVVRMHRGGRGFEVLRAAVDTASKARRENYAATTDAYSRWARSRQLEWFAVSPRLFGSTLIDLNVNPELGLKIDGVPHIVKLYFRAEALTKGKAAMGLSILSEAYAPLVRTGVVPAMLDIRRGKLFTPPFDPSTVTLLRGEIAAFAALWAEIEDQRAA